MHLPVFVTLASVAAAASYALTTPATLLSLASRSSSCSIPGQLLCHSLDTFGLCTEAHTVIWMATSDGTSCVCNSYDFCKIVASSDAIGGPEPSETTSTLTSTPSTSSASVPTSYTTSSAITSSPTPYSTSSAIPSATPSVPDTGSNYTQFNGNGSPQDGWPAIGAWLSFEELFDANQPIGSECETAFGVTNNQPNDTIALHDALLDQAKAAGVPPEFALAITLQESLGCVFVDTTTGSVANPGLMQDHDGAASCEDQATCPEATIQSMLKQGLSGTSSGAGIKQCYEQAPSSNLAQRWYQAARIYNSGSLGPNGDLGADAAGTSCYASDIANRLIGWCKGPSGCTTAD